MRNPLSKLFDGTDRTFRYEISFCGHVLSILVPKGFVDAAIMPSSELGADYTSGEVAGVRLGFSGVFVRRDYNYSEGFYSEGFETFETELPANAIAGPEANDDKLCEIVTRLGLLTKALNFKETFAVEDQHQLVLISICSAKNRYGLNTIMAPELRQWIENNRETAHTTAAEAMIAVAKRIWPKYFSGKKHEREYAEQSFDVIYHRNENKGISFRVAGNACDLSVDGFELDYGPGWQLTEHNIDHPGQLLMLLAGVYSMVKQYRLSLQK